MEHECRNENLVKLYVNLFQPIQLEKGKKVKVMRNVKRGKGRQKARTRTKARVGRQWISFCLSPESQQAAKHILLFTAVTLIALTTPQKGKGSRQHKTISVNFVPVPRKFCWNESLYVNYFCFLSQDAKDRSFTSNNLMIPNLSDNLNLEFKCSAALVNVNASPNLPSSHALIKK